jgi:hypothetical protein
MPNALDAKSAALLTKQAGFKAIGTVDCHCSSCSPANLRDRYDANTGKM